MQHQRCYGFLVAGMLSGMVLPPTGGAATYYVATTGSDSHACVMAQQEAYPKRTIQGGLRCLASGDTLMIKGGTYPERLSNPPSGISEAQPTTIASAPGETARLRPVTGTGDMLRITQPRRYLVFDGLHLDGTGLPSSVLAGGMRVSATQAQHIVFQNGEVGPLPNGDGFIVDGGVTDMRVLNTYIHDTGGAQGQCGRTPGATPGCHGLYWRGSGGLIEGNHIARTSGYGIQLYSSGATRIRGNVIRQNVFQAIAKAGVLFDANAEQSLFVNNIVMHASTGITTSGQGNKVYNNTIYHTTSYGIRQKGQPTTLTSAQAAFVKNNIFFHVGGAVPSGNCTADPLFVDAPNGNLRLQASSPAIDAGVLLGEVSEDFEGMPRPVGARYDCGAFEFH